MGSHWAAGVHFNKEDYPDVVRSLVRLSFTRESPNGVFGFIEGALTPIKPSADIEVGGGWHRGGSRVTVSAAVLDAFNDVIYQSLNVYHVFADTALDYQSHPVMLRTNFDVPLGPRFRPRDMAGWDRPGSRVRPDGRTRVLQQEDYGFVGGLFEWMASPRDGRRLRVHVARSQPDAAALRQNHARQLPADGADLAGRRATARADRARCCSTWARM
jgi:hypothetical protein